MSRPPVSVIVAGGAVSRFGRFTDTTLPDLAAPVLREALAEAATGPSGIEAAFVGNAFSGWLTGQESILAQTLLAPAGIAGVPVHTVKNACSSGADALHLAWAAIAFGQYDRVLVLGAEKLTHADRAKPFAALASASDRTDLPEGRSIFMDVNAERARAYMERTGATPRHFAQVAVKNRRHASLNERAAQRDPLEIEQVLADRVVIEPLTRAMCGGLADGAAAIVLMSEAAARAAGVSGPRVIASAVVSGQPAGGPNATERAGRLAYQMAGIGPEAISLAEVHDPTSPQELFDLEDLGLCPRGEGPAWVDAGATSLGGRLPINVSGGLASRGHPVGATGVAQVVEIAEQLRGRAGPRQVEGARIGLAQMAGGLLGADSAVAAVHILAV